MDGSNIDMRPGHWIQTFTGGRFYILDPREEEVDIFDIAHSLSMQCRYLGHAHNFYSVAQHSVLLATWCREKGMSPESQFEALMHDAHEAYTGDIPKPIKVSIPILQDAEKRVEDVVRRKYRLQPDMPDWCHQIDRDIVVDEKRALMADQNGWTFIGSQPLGVEIKSWEPEMAELCFLTLFTHLQKLIRGGN